MSYHLTGLYPDWWKGRKFTKPINAWAAGVSNPKTVAVVQSELLGKADNPLAFGMGAIPQDCIVETTRWPGIPHGKQSATIKHYTNGKMDGYSTLGFLSYEMGFEKFMGSPLDVIWLDEQPPYDIFSQCMTRTADTQGMVYMTFTPETGMTPVIYGFLNNLKPGQALIRAGWDDCPHLTEETKKQLLAVYMPHERAMRSKGEPSFGAGNVFTTPEEKIIYDPNEVTMQPYWPRIAGLDFGWDHPTAVVWIAYDRDRDILYIYDCYRQRKTPIPIHASAINGRGNVPIAWPHDGEKTGDQNAGATWADLFRQEGCNMLPMRFTNPPAPGEPEGKGGNAIESGIMAMITRFETGKLKVNANLHEWLTEYRQYHRDFDTGKIVDKVDDLMSATRYAVQSRRFASFINHNGKTFGFYDKIDYPDLGIV
jgi:phage terminase large subunit-like protein